MHLDARGIPPLEILVRENTRHASVSRRDRRNRKDRVSHPVEVGFYLGFSLSLIDVKFMSIAKKRIS